MMVMMMMMMMMMMLMMHRGEEREREEEEVVYNDQPESDQHFNLPRIQVIMMMMRKMMMMRRRRYSWMRRSRIECGGREDGKKERKDGLQVNGPPDSLLDLTRLSQVSDDT